MGEATITKQQLIEWRRHLHMHPELSFQEKETSQFVYDTLCTFPHLEVLRPTKYSVMARLIGDNPGKTIAIRADMDALPIQEENDFEFISRHSGVMHACGHDGHTSILLGTAYELAHRKQDISGEVRFLFQHAEEDFPGGAEEMVQAGVMDGVDYVIGAHLWSPIASGKIGLVYGPAMASPDTFSIIISGKGGHAGIPHETIDSIAIGTQLVSHLQQIVSRHTDPLDSLVVSVTEFHAGTTHNVIPSNARIGGTVRCLRHELRQQTAERIERIARAVAEAHGASVAFQYDYGYRPVVNDENVTRCMEEVALKLFGNDNVMHMAPTMAGEDFSAFLQKAPGCFVFIGVRNEEKGIIYPHHHPRFTIDEDVLPTGVSLFVEAVFNLLD